MTPSEMTIEEYEQGVEKVKETYGPIFLSALNQIKRAAERAGWTATDVWEENYENYRWSFLVSPIARDFEGDEHESDIDVVYELIESKSLGNETEGVAWSLDISSYGGSIIGGFTPGNYTDDLWVDMRDDEAIKRRFGKVDQIDASGTIAQMYEWAVMHDYINRIDDEYDPKLLAMLSGHDFGALLDQWHGGGGSYVYAVSSTMYVGHEPRKRYVEGAIRELRRLKQDANYPEAVSDEDLRQVNNLADELYARFLAGKEDEPLKVSDGYCPECAADVNPNDTTCWSCKTVFEEGVK